jgi:hypothetical protein
MHAQFSALPVKILGLIADFSSASKTLNPVHLLCICASGTIKPTDRSRRVGGTDHLQGVVDMQVEEVETSQLQHALDVVESLSVKEQETLLDVVRRRLVEWRREQIALNAQATRQAVREGSARYDDVY